MSCVEELLQGALSGWARSDVKVLIDTLADKTALQQRLNPGMSYNDALESARKALSDEVEIDAQSARLNSAKNALKTLEGISRVRAFPNPVDGLRSLLIGTQKAVANARRGAAQEQRAVRDHYLGGLQADIARVDGGLALYASGDLEDDMARALRELGQASPRLDGLDPRAVEFAKAIRKWQDIAKLDANEAGAMIGQLDDYITRTSHDPGKIAADRAGWEARARAEFDFKRMGVSDAEIPGLLDRLYDDLRDGIHLKAGGRSGKKVPAGAGRSLSKERVIHFRDADGWMRYNREFGAGSLRESVHFGLEAASRATGLMRHLGPDHEMNFQRIVDSTLRDLKAEGGDTVAFESAAKRYRSLYLADLDGSTTIPGSNTLASYGATIRGLQRISALGSAALSSVSDLGTVMLAARHNDASMFDALGATVGTLFSNVKGQERLDMLSDLGTSFESINGKITASGRFMEDDIGGKLGRLQHQFFSLNLQTWWTDAMKSGAAEFLSMNLARKVGKGYDDLGDLTRTLGLYGIDAAAWDVIRKGALREVDGRAFLTPSALDDLPDSAFANVGGRTDLKSRLRMYFTDQRGYMVLEPDSAVTGALNMGTQRGTPIGEAVRLIMQFKSFPFAFTQRIVGRELQHYGWHGAARVVIATTAFGYLAMTLKDLAKGRNPRDITEDPLKTAMAAFQQGGGAGLYSDLLFSQVVDRRFQDAGMQLLGPTASDLLGSSGLSGIAARALRARDGDDAADVGAATTRFVQSNAPMINLFWTKPAFDALIFWHLQEELNPGSMQRMETELEQRTGQTMYVSPSEVVN